MDLITFAIPLFILLMLVEWAYGWRVQRQTYRLNDTVNSLSMGSIRTLGKLVFFDFSIYLFAWLADWLEIIQWPSHWFFWVLAFVAYDFLYYWFHRISHERNLFWASHIAHHQSEEFNLSTALRQTGTGFLCSWVFYIPLFLLGCPPEMYYTVAALNLLYQFWVHTEHIGKLGWYEAVFVTPSNHRVHHARNPHYIDRNYGGVFIVWDRLFGSFCEENDAEPCQFGISEPLRSWNPFWANVHVYLRMWEVARSRASWTDGLAVLMQPPLALKKAGDAPLPETEYQKYDPPVAREVKTYIAAQFVLLLLLASWLGLPDSGVGQAGVTVGFLIVLSAYVALGLLLENRSVAYWLEIGRFVVIFGIILWLALASGPLSSTWLAAIALVCLASCIHLVQLMRNDSQSVE